MRPAVDPGHGLHVAPRPPADAPTDVVPFLANGLFKTTLRS